MAKEKVFRISKRARKILQRRQPHISIVTDEAHKKVGQKISKSLADFAKAKRLSFSEVVTNLEQHRLAFEKWVKSRRGKVTS